MRLRIRAIAIATLLALLGLLPSGAPVAASGAQPSTPPAVTTAAPYNCQSSTTDHGWVGDTTSTGTDTPDIYGLESYLTANLDDCVDTSGTDLTAGASAWIAVTGPSSGGGTCGTPAVNCRIIQYGIIVCAAASAQSDEACYGSRASTPRFFYAWGRGSSEPSCAYGSHLPRAIDLGAASLLHRYELRLRLLNGTWYFYKDNVLVKTLTNTLCWPEASSLVNQAQWSGERWDGADSVGISTNPTVFDGTIEDLTSPSPPVTGESGTWGAHVLSTCSATGDQASEQHCSTGNASNNFMDIWDVLQ